MFSETLARSAGSGKIGINFTGKGGALNLADCGENVYGANGDFYAIGVENGVAIFRWVESLDNGYSLQVGFAQVPEPAAVAAFFGALALGFAALRRRKRRFGYEGVCATRSNAPAGARRASH